MDKETGVGVGVRGGGGGWSVMEYYSAIEKEILPPVATQMSPVNTMPSEINQAEKDKCVRYHWNVLSKNTKLIETALTGGCQGLKGGEMSVGTKLQL